jgi:hypothetical protein
MGGANVGLFVHHPKAAGKFYEKGVQIPYVGPAQSSGGTSAFEGLAQLGGFYLAPATGFLGLFGPRNKTKSGLPITAAINVDTGQVDVSVPDAFSFLPGKAKKNVEAARAAINARLTSLGTEAYQTGVVPTSTPGGARELFEGLAAQGRVKSSMPESTVELNQGGPIAAYRREFVSPIIPTGANTGWLTQTPAAKALLAQLGSRSTTGRKRATGGKRRSARKRTRKVSAVSKRRRTTGSSRRRSGGKFVKGSPAAKRFMARLRAMRKK